MTGITLEELVGRLKADSPSIWTRVVRGTMLLAVNCLAHGEDAIGGDRIVSVLSDNAGRGH